MSIFHFFRDRKRARLLAQPIPESWESILANTFPLYRKMDEVDRAELQRHMQIFLGEKRFRGGHGLVVTEEMRVTIAAQACLLLMHRNCRYYPTLRTIFVYPSAYFAGQPDGDVQRRLGESWQYGPVVLAWDSSRRGGKNVYDGRNVVLHEFAHQLDQMDGDADGMPALGIVDETGELHLQYRSWAMVFTREFRRHVKKSNKGRKTVIDHYGATNPAEFFACATEAFFEKPRSMNKKHPELYEELKAFYRQDPLKWSRIK